MKKEISIMLVVFFVIISIFPLLYGNKNVLADENIINEATDVTFGKTYYLDWTGDPSEQYVVQFTMPKHGKISIQASQPYAISSYASYDFAVYKSDGSTKVYDNNCYYQRFDVNLDVGLPAGMYYLTVSIKSYIGRQSTETSLKISYSASNYYEKEPNNSLDKATQLDYDKYYSGFIGETDDLPVEDYFSFNLTKGRCYRIYIGEYYFLVRPKTLLLDFLGPDGEDLSLTSFPDSKGKEDYFAHIEYNKDSIGRYYEFIPNQSGRYYLCVYNYHGKDGEFPYKVMCKDMSPKVSINLNITDMILGCKKSKTIKATTTNTKSKPTWTSSDPSIATVDNNGKVVGKSLGQTTIIAKVDGKEAICRVQVLYNDVMDESAFWYEPTYALTDLGVVKGYSNQSAFKPGNECTRAQMVTFLWRLDGEPKPRSSKNPFPDVKKGEYYYKAVLWAVEQGITTGYSDGSFKPQNVCTRAQTVTFLWRMAGEPDPDSPKNKFKDVKQSDYYYKAVLWASEMKIVAGYKDGTFKPKGKCLRRQMVTFLYKYSECVI